MFSSNSYMHHTLAAGCAALWGHLGGGVVWTAAVAVDFLKLYLPKPYGGLQIHLSSKLAKNTSERLKKTKKDLTLVFI